jgi:hypothetical protein
VGDCELHVLQRGANNEARRRGRELSQ